MMDSLNIWYLLTSLPKRNWGKLLCLANFVWECPEAARWRRVIVCNNAIIGAVINNLDNKELELWLTDKKYYPRIIQTIFAHGRQEVFYGVVPRTVEAALILVVEAARFGDMEILTWVTGKNRLKEAKTYSRYLDAFAAAAKNGHLPAVKWIVNYFEITSIHTITNYAYGILHMIAGNGHLKTLKWIANKFNCSARRMCSIIDSGLHRIIERGDLPMVQWLLTENKSSVYYNYQRQWIILAARYGHTEMLKWLIQLHGANTPILIDAATGAIKGGHSELFKWFANRYDWKPTDILRGRGCPFHVAISHGRFELLQWIVQKYKITRTNIMGKWFDVFKAPLEDDKLEIIKWLAETFDLDKKYILANDTIFKLTENNEEGLILKWAIEKYNPSCNEILAHNSVLLRRIAKHDLLDLFKWLDDKYDFTRDDIILDDNKVLRLMIQCGHLEMLKWAIDEFMLDDEDILYENYFVTETIEKPSWKVLRWLDDKYDIS